MPWLCLGLGRHLLQLERSRPDPSSPDRTIHRAHRRRVTDIFLDPPLFYSLPFLHEIAYAQSRAQNSEGLASDASVLIKIPLC